MFASAQDPSTSRVVGDVGIAPIQGTAARRSATVNGGMSSMISAGSKHPEEAWKYAMYLSSQTVQAEHSQNALPIWKSLFDNKTVIDINPEIVPVAKVQYDYLVNRPMVPYYGALSTAMQAEIQAALFGKKSTDAALKAMQETAENLKAK
jgi:multiple sugar transport system substrate-binding protein